ncbi:MAG: ABC transporter ATP-binding protein [Gammaproteobacteria bacterium]|nr:ABC transporter ATP-binding protein [Gammaproteobacteria bacterium]
MIEIKNVYKTYDKQKYVLNDVSLEIEDGDIYAFIGHNGAGKTTLIKSIVGILPFEKGEITINGIDVNQNPEESKKTIAYIPDEPEIYDSLTGLQFLNFVADAFDVSEIDRKERIEHYAQVFEMTEHLNNLVSSYSHGMKQKTIIMSALIHNPKVIIMDEPFVGLDPKASIILKQLMSDFVKNGGCIFYSTHVLDTAEKICNKIAVIKNGEIVKAGSRDVILKDESLEQVFMEIYGEGQNA